MKFEIIFQNIEYIFEAMGVTLKITGISFLFGVIIAMVVGIIRVEYNSRYINCILNIYIEVFRGTPLLIQLFFIYYGLPSIGISMDSFTAAILGLSLNSGAYMAEVIRGGILAVDKGQREAGLSLGFTKIQTLLYIVFPQAVRVVIPAIVNSFSSLLKESSLVSILAITELTRMGQLIYTRTYRAFEIYLVLGILYFILTFIVSLISKRIEYKINKAY
ncbi:MAG: amino acid ABC transporter permease [Clostridium sp.]